MSLLSNFGDLGYFGGLPSSAQRLIQLAPMPLHSYQTSWRYYSIQISDTPGYLLYRTDGNVNVSTHKNSWTLYNLSTGKATIKSHSKSGLSDDSGYVLLPINNTIIASDPTGSGTPGCYYSTDEGATWTIISGTGAGVNTPWTLQSRSSLGGMGAWWDGTNFVFTDSGLSSWRTTNGTSYTSLSPALDYPCFSGNNRSAYSGYWFSIAVTGQDYTYRTAYNASPTTVTGYVLNGMSRNGRYLTRTLVSNGQMGYSNDGGASWSVFSDQIFFGSNYETSRNACWLPSDNGTFWCVMLNGTKLYYDFSVNRWIALPSLAQTVSSGLILERAAIGAQECLTFAAWSNGTGIFPATSSKGIADFPRLG